MNKAELEEVFKIYQNSVTQCQFEHETVKYHCELVKNNLAGSKILEVGCGIGTVSCYLFSFSKNLTIVDGSKSSLEFTKSRLKDNNDDISSINFIEELWEQFNTNEKFSDIVFLRGAEHIDDPAFIINKLKKFLLPGGRFHISVPNGQSLHRKVGACLGMLDTPGSFTAGDFKVHHRHVFDYWSARNMLVNTCKMNIHLYRGVLLKFLSNVQMNNLFTENPELPRALHEAGQEIPHLCAELYFCATNDTENL
jgi:2-polyprenyl-3-methyl-5-hydroxy-6-metoxy-1,4-benzoquinol methylase